jgi:hypothetical protein
MYFFFTNLVPQNEAATEKKVKETLCAPDKRIEITARLTFNFVLVRLGLHPPKEVLER